MRLRVLYALAFCIPFLLPAQQTTTQPRPQPASTQQSTTTGPATGRHYTNVDGKHVHSPMTAPSAPTGSTAKCGDGTYSFSQHSQGTCSHHGGVVTWMIH